MPLIPAELQASFLRLYQKPPRKLRQVMQKLTEAYRDYASKGTAGGIFPVFTGLEVNAMKGVLTATFKAPHVGNPATAAAAWDQAVLSFWLANPPGSLFPTALLVAYVPGPLTTSLTSVFSNIGNTAISAAASHSAAMDVATRTVLVTLPGPVVVPLV